MTTVPAAPAAPFVPDVTAIAADLQDDHVHIDHAVADQITAEQLSAITASIDASPIPMFVLAVPLGRDSTVTPVQLVSLVHRQQPADGIWFVAQQVGDEWTIESTTYDVPVGSDEDVAGYAASQLYPADLGLQLQEVTDLIATGTAREVYDELYPDTGSSTSTSTTRPDDGAQLLGVDMPVALTGIGVLVVLIAVLGLRRRPGSRHEVEVKGRALERISRAQTDSWRHRAQQETDRLGDRINALEIGDGADREAWTAALDHFDAANRILDRTTAAAHSIGALVLARRGDDALTHAVEGRPWQPTAVCFFNPLHGAAMTTVRWKTAAGSRDVPACNDCRRLVRKKKEPDFLDLPVKGSVVNYVDADQDAEPWASTGYGSLDADLLARVREI